MLPEFTAFSAAGHAEDCRGKRDIPGAAHRRWRAFYLRQLSASWLHFTSMTHAEYAVGAAVPALTWGKLQNGVIPVAGRFNHAFVDGLHASRFYALVEEGFNDPERLWLPLNRNRTLPASPSGEGALTSARNSTAREPYSLHGGRYGATIIVPFQPANTAQV